MDSALLFSVLSGVTILLVLILWVRIQAFLALLIASICVGLFAGLSPQEIIKTVQDGMGGTLGFVAVVVGLGAIFGAILEHSGGAQALATQLIKTFGEKRASWAMVITGFLVAIPVFFDVGFIILVPLVYALQRRTGKSLLVYALPLLSGLAITHAFIPPTPGPVAVADILNADLGWVILLGVIVGIPTAVVSGPIFSNFISKQIHVSAPHENEIEVTDSLPSIGIIIGIIGLPIVLILSNTVLSGPLLPEGTISDGLKSILQLIGHPFTALILANVAAWYLLGIRRNFSRKQLQEISTKSLSSAGIIILLTGAGGVFKQVLVNTGSGEMLAQYFASGGFNILTMAFVTASLIRILQGSSTVAMITAAGLCSPLIPDESSEIFRALIVLTIASGASILSHVNDSGFWLVSKYLGLTEKETFRSWTVMTTILALTGFICCLIVSAFL